MYENNDRQLYDLPLQLTSPNRPPPTRKLVDLPRQLPNDHYRLSNKQNCLKDEEINLLDQILSQEDIRVFGDRAISGKKAPKKDQSHLRNIIKKKLFTANKNRHMEDLRTMKKDGEKGKGSKYHQLLTQFYGGPKQFNSKPKRPPSTANKQQSTLKRHQSAKSIQPASQQLPTFQRMRSYSSLKQPKSIVPSLSKQLTAQSSEKVTYLDLYMQKRRPVLYL